MVTFSLTVTAKPLSESVVALSESVVEFLGGAFGVQNEVFSGVAFQFSCKVETRIWIGRTQLS